MLDTMEPYCWDRHDVSAPPLAPGDAIAVYFPHTNNGRFDPYSVDMRGSYSELGGDILSTVGEVDLWGHVWRFDIVKNRESDFRPVTTRGQESTAVARKREYLRHALQKWQDAEHAG